MVETLHKYRYLVLLFYVLMALLLTVIIRQDAFMLLNFAIVGALISFLLIKNEVLLLIATILAAIFHEGIYFINGTYIIIYLYGLMVISLLFNKRRIDIAPAVLFIAMLAILLSLAPIFDIGSSLPIVAISAIKRFGFIILFVFALNITNLYKKYSNLLNWLIVTILVVNFLVAVVQYFQGIYNQDDITGFLGGNTTGVFMYLFMFYLAILSGLHYYKKISTFLFFALTMIPIIYSAIAEVKIGFVSIAILLIVYLVFINKGLKSLLLLIATSFVFSWAYFFLISVYPEHDFLNMAFLDEYLVEQSYGGDGTINRFGFKPTVDAVVFEEKNSEIIFGKGLGSGNPSEMDILKGEVYRNFDYLKYSWFTLPYLYIETGWVGTIAYVLIYILPLIIALKAFKREKSMLAIIVILMSVTNFVFLPYNAGLFSYGVTTIYWIYVAMLINDKKSAVTLVSIKDQLIPAKLTLVGKPALKMNEAGGSYDLKINKS
ncbi:hypothetical protein [Planococcus glaciei]|uniref:hypothetical protein n=1 Tax=Planococcus glaciei TaxID=459472 RepID=UPI001C72F005|nr:hypothetical protein [Planococcus glaciei]MBX0313325.1 hypothetical protein [Planococcus glaciei]